MNKKVGRMRARHGAAALAQNTPTNLSPTSPSCLDNIGLT